MVDATPLLETTDDAPLLDAARSSLQIDGPSNGNSARGDTSVLKTFLNLYNQLEGLGLLAIPYVMRLGGWGAPAALPASTFPYNLRCF